MNVKNKIAVKIIHIVDKSMTLLWQIKLNKVSRQPH